MHASGLGWHGNLRSTNCLIDDRWQVKLSEFGLKFFRTVEVCKVVASKDSKMLRSWKLSFILFFVTFDKWNIRKIAYAQTTSVIAIPQQGTTTGMDSPLHIKIGMIFPANESAPGSFSNTASAVTLALERIFREQLLPPGTNISFIWRFDECVRSNAVGYAFELIDEHKVDVLIAPPCIDGALLSSHVGTYYKIPTVVWGPCFDSQFTEPGLYPSLILSSVICSALEFFDWDVYSLIYQISNNGICDSFQKDMDKVSQSKNNCLISYKQAVDNWSDESIQATLAQIKANSRIVVMCFDDNDKLREFALRLEEAGMAEPEYVYIISRLRREWPVINGTVNPNLQDATLKATPWWIDTKVPRDNRDEDAFKFVQRSFRLQQDRRSPYISVVPNFSTEVMAKMKEWPFYCVDCDHGQVANPYASTLYDAMYAYALALSRTINESGLANIRNGEVVTNGGDIVFNGLSGTISLGSDGKTNAKFVITSFDDMYGSIKPQLRFQANDGGVNISWAENASEATIWKSRGGIKPLSTPLCGFDGKGCPVNFFEEYRGIWIVAMVLVAFAIFGICAGIYYVIRLKKEEIERQNRLWRIPSSTLNKLLQSMHSIKSNTASTTSSRFTFDSVKTITYGDVFIIPGSGRVVGITHSGMSAQLDSKEMAELRAGFEFLFLHSNYGHLQMRVMDHDNVNRFVGLSIDSSQVMSLWRYCSRGPLSDVITGNTSLNLDGFFIYSLIRDVCEGLCFIHASPIGLHGNLRSTNCLVDDRWQPIWENTDAKGNAEEVVYMLKKGGRNPFRPSIQPATQDLSPAITHLVKDCWNENPLERPKVGTVRSLLTSMNTAKSANLMDHVFTLLEQYAGSLEEDIEERTKQLVEEKKKSDILLYRMLPKQVAEKLKLGQAVEPESFDSVTLFFSDVVSFTTLASKCSPLQVVNLLNDLYTLLDSIIGEYDVYKVETIGDGYLCVSGLPHRNGNEHARHAANMSLAIMRSLKHFSIPHLPGEQIRLRIGLHTGPCVAGVVGLSMPRYCLFGDNVNTASRMESNSRPMMIHISASTNHFLTNTIGGFVTQSRGEVIIKGKGVMETFWLLGHEGDPNLRDLVLNAETIVHLAEAAAEVKEEHKINRNDIRGLTNATELQSY
ncbi:adenylate and guanylate cyclase catalytic domain-containing protein [Ditylenchus destructor]|uniref:guanylate cyclase n=1 Tax=Ditylenchus destructor TaxID=166010 RepID=A0AAD4MPV2_9BILA|nr:adenylate and guanylate cyclase catalytic domain-containing protein [Ditylenchus destructor]